MTGSAICLFGDKFMHFSNYLKIKYRSTAYDFEKR